MTSSSDVTDDCDDEGLDVISSTTLDISDDSLATGPPIGFFLVFVSTLPGKVHTQCEYRLQNATTNAITAIQLCCYKPTNTTTNIIQKTFSF